LKLTTGNCALITENYKIESIPIIPGGGKEVARG
jgi:hypothetical protein